MSITSMRPKCVRAKAEYNPSPEPPNLTAGRCLDFQNNPDVYQYAKRYHATSHHQGTDQGLRRQPAGGTHNVIEQLVLKPTYPII